MKNRKKLTGARAVGLLRYLPLILWVAFFVFAFGWIVLASFSTTKEIFSNGLLQSGVHVENYTGVWERNHVAHYFVNSLITTGIPCVLIILIAAPAAYVLSKKTFFGRKQTFNAFVVGMSIPQVMLVIPIYCWFVKANLVGHLSTLVILYTTLNLPYTVYFLTAFFSTVPTALAEAAMIDGAGKWRQLWHITLASLRGTIITLLIFRVGGIMNAGFDQIFAMSNYLTISVCEIIDTYVYKLGMESRKFSEATAAGLFQSLIGLVLVLATNFIAKKIDPESGIM